MLIVLGMARAAILRSRPEVRQGAGIKVAQSARLAGMFPGQREGEGVVAEGAAIRLHPVVASQAVVSKILCVDRHVRRIDLHVAG